MAARVSTHEFQPATCLCKLAQEVREDEAGEITITPVGIVSKCLAHTVHTSPAALANAIAMENRTLAHARIALRGTDAEMVRWAINDKREVEFTVAGASAEVREKLGAMVNLVVRYVGE